MSTLGPAAKRYEQLTTDREAYLRRGRECSLYTIPSLLPESGHNPTSDLPTPWQGIGAKGVNSLASKLLLSLFPPNAPFFRMLVDTQKIPDLERDPKKKTEYEEALAKYEERVTKYLETIGARVPLFEALKHVLVVGNVVVYAPPKRGVRIFHLDRYVLVRDGEGSLIELVIKESISPLMLPEKVRELPELAEYLKDSPEKNLDLYTHVKRIKPGRFVEYQEVCGREIPGSQGKYSAKASPWIALRGIRIDGESYGRSYVDEYLGDVRAAEGLSQSLVEGAAIVSKCLWGVDPASPVKPASLAKTRNGGFVVSRPDQIFAIRAEKNSDLAFAASQLERIESRLDGAFLSAASVQRDAERVTAEEVRIMAAELESTLGGMYSLLASELQLPLVQVLISQLEKTGALPELPEGYVTPTVITGLEALGRGHDLTRLRTAFGIAKEVLGDTYIGVVNQNEALARIFLAAGIEKKGLLKDEEQLQAEQQAAQQAALTEKAVGPALQAASKMAAAAPTPQGTEAP